MAMITSNMSRAGHPGRSEVRTRIPRPGGQHTDISRNSVSDPSVRSFDNQPGGIRQRSL